MVYTASNLTIGQDYKVQFFNYNAPGATITSGNSVTIDDQYVIGTFKADAETQVFNISSGGGINAAQIRIVNDSWTPADGIWTGGDGNWNTVGNWQANTIGQGIDKSATFNGLTPVTATVDVIRPIGALNFSGANHTLAAGSGSLTLDVDTLTTPTVTVADGITATIAATLGGSEGMVKDGSGHAGTHRNERLHRHDRQSACRHLATDVGRQAPHRPATASPAARCSNSMSLQRWAATSLRALFSQVRAH